MRQSQITNISTPAKKFRAPSLEQFNALEIRVNELSEKLNDMVDKKPAKKAVKKTKE